jgi:uncharacterized protein (TIGR02646 family)
MISLTRTRTATAINKKFRGQEKKDQDLILMTDQQSLLNGTIDKHDFKSTYWKTSKNQLKKESANKCTYCEANTSVVAHGDVEHFRPKSEYWWLAYTYDNYLFACQICNQTYKSDNFPITAAKFIDPGIKTTTTNTKINSLVGNISPDPLEINLNYTLTKYVANHRKEKSLLLNPYFDDPTKHFAWEFDDNKKEVKLIPASNTAFTKQVVQGCLDFYGLNRPELLSLRYTEFRKFRAFKKGLTENISTALKAETKAIIKDMLDDKSSFAGMLRYFDSLALANLG